MRSTTPSDRVQIQELLINCELAELGREMGCQTMVEGPGHIPINEIEANIIMEKKMSGESPFYMLGPITTDIAPGYDHITAAIGAALSSSYGADFICYVTPSEHLGLPFPEDVQGGSHRIEDRGPCRRHDQVQEHACRIRRCRRRVAT